MSRAIYSTELAYDIARAALARGPIGAIDGIVLKEMDSPWDEKIRLRFKRNLTKAVFYIWRSPEFLTGRIHRLTLYAFDSLDPIFQYDPMAALSLDPKIRETHNHIWSIYVDSRIAKMGFENFFDRTLRRNLFVDSQKTYPWSLSNRFFQKLWEKESFTHPEIIDYSRNPNRLLEHGETRDSDAFEVEINRFVADRSLRDQVENMPSPELKGIALSLLEFVASACPGTLVEPSYYGLYFMFEQEMFAEMVITKRDFLLLTLFDFQTEKQMSYVLGTDPRDMEQVQGMIKEIYDAISCHAYLKSLKEPYDVPIEG